MSTSGQGAVLDRMDTTSHPSPGSQGDEPPPPPGPRDEAGAADEGNRPGARQIAGQFQWELLQLICLGSGGQHVQRPPPRGMGRPIGLQCPCNSFTRQEVRGASDSTKYIKGIQPSNGRAVCWLDSRISVVDATSRLQGVAYWVSGPEPHVLSLIHI